MVSGECWLGVDGVDDVVRLTAGDCVLLTSRKTPCLASDTTPAPIDVLPFFRAVPEGGIATINGGGQFSGLGGFFDLAGKHAELLLARLPPLMHIRKESDRARLRLSMEMMMQELRNPQPVGASLLVQQLGHIMLVLALRLHLAEGTTGVGWLSALGDRQMAAAINAMHREPGASVYTTVIGYAASVPAASALQPEYDSRFYADGFQYGLVEISRVALICRPR